MSSSDGSLLGENTDSNESTNRIIKNEVTPAPAYVKLENIDSGVKCLLCLTNLNDPIKYGDFYKLEGLICHYFCLLFASSLVQNGQDHEGILGFFAKDIKAEIRRGSRLRCSYCRKSGATIGCYLKACKKAFHLPCGLENGSMHQFFDRFKSFCCSHRPTQTIDPKVLKAAEDEEDLLLCPICYDKVPNQISNETLWAPCCRKRWFHRHCLQRQALAQGYFFRCPLCNNKKEFKHEMRNFGIYTPKVDAAWELEPHAFQELLETYRRCDADVCKCPSGRNTSQNTGSWRLLKCNACGSQGTHIVCSGLKMASSSHSWRCPLCVETLSRASQRSSTQEALRLETPRLRVVSAQVPSSSSTAAFSSSSSSSSSSSTSQRRPADFACSLRPQANKKRKSSPQIDNEDTVGLNKNREPCASSNDQYELCPVSHLDKSTIENRQSLQSLDAIPGPSRLKEAEEDEIIVVDDSDDDLQILNEVLVRHAAKPFNSSFTCTTEENSRELMTKEGKKIKVHKVDAEDHAVPVEVETLGAVSMKNSNTKEEYKPFSAPESKRTEQCSSSQRLECNLSSKENISAKSRIDISPIKSNLPSTSKQSNMTENECITPRSLDNSNNRSDTNLQSYLPTPIRNGMNHNEDRGSANKKSKFSSSTSSSPLFQPRSAIDGLSPNVSSSRSDTFMSCENFRRSDCTPAHDANNSIPTKSAAAAGFTAAAAAAAAAARAARQIPTLSRHSHSGLSHHKSDYGPKKRPRSNPHEDKPCPKRFKKSVLSPVNCF